jgi:hypothetical protein
VSMCACIPRNAVFCDHHTSHAMLTCFDINLLFNLHKLSLLLTMETAARLSCPATPACHAPCLPLQLLLAHTGRQHL